MQADTKNRISVKKSGKLPRLTIQQQIDNQEVVERMNRKITFTKNPRHLNQSLPFSQAMTLPHQQSVFIAHPQSLNFTAYEVHHTYQAEIQLINHSQHTQRIKIAPLAKRQFVIANVKYPSENSGDIAPGLHVSVFVRFRPVSLHEYSDELIVIVGDGVLKVPIVARREQWAVDWPKKIECGHCWVGDSISTKTILKNIGGETVFSIKDASDPKNYQIGCFKVSPTQVKLGKGETVQFFIEFSPNKEGSFNQKFQIESDQGQQKPVEIQLTGGAYTAHLQLERINGDKIKEQKTHYPLFINHCQIGKPNKATIQIKNLAVVGVDYFWVSSNSQLKIVKKQGKMKPAASEQFEFIYTPKKRQSVSIDLSLFLCNLPKESLGSNTVLKDIDGKQGIECLVFHAQTRSKHSLIRITPLHQEIQQKMYVGIPIQCSIILQNNSQSERSFKIKKVQDDPNSLCECETKEGLLLVDQKIQVFLSYKITELTPNSCRSYFMVEFDNSPSQVFSIEGKVTYPSVRLSTSCIYYGLCRTYTSLKKRLVISNENQTETSVRFNNPHKYYKLDFHDLYEFDSEEYHIRKLDIETEIPYSKQGWVVIPAKDSCWVDFQIQTMESQTIDLEVTLQVKEGKPLPITVEAYVQDVQMDLINSSINLKQIYKGNTYNSNKFLRKEIAILNQGNIAAQYQIFLQPNSLCSIRLDPMKNIVKANSKQRLDLLIQPLKTGSLEAVLRVQFYDSVNLFPAQYSQDNRICEKTLQKKKKLVGTRDLKILATISGVQIKYYIKDESRAKRVKQKITEDGATSVKMSTISGKSNSKTHLQNQRIIYPELEELHFYNCEINQVRQLQIIIENASELTAQFEIQSEKFCTLQKAPNSSKRSNRGLIGTEQQAFTSQMGQTFIKARILDRSQKTHLSNNKGISIMCQPPNGVLHKKQTQKIVVTMFNDTSGRFRDNLVVTIKDHQEKRFPIDIHIKGTPVSLSRNQLGIDFNRDIPLMSLGTFMQSNGSTKRNIKLVNNGPKPVSIDWLIYPYNKINQDKNFFEIDFGEGVPGSSNLVQTNWTAIKPEIDADSPFSIEPKNKILQGREEAVFTLHIKSLEKTQQFSNLLIGEPCLIEQGVRTPMDSLGVILTGECVHPVLHMDRKHENHINKFQRFAVQPKAQQTNSKNHHRKLKLKNHFRANVSFTLSVQSQNRKFQSFEIVSTSSDSKLNSIQSRTAMNFVQKSYILEYQSYVQVGIDLKANPKNLNEWPMEKQVRRDGTLIIEFSNGEKQQMSLVGWLYRPWAEVLMPNELPFSVQNCQIDYGTVHIKNRKKATIYISNPSKSIAKWSISYLKYHQSIKFKFQEALWTDQDREDQMIKDQNKCFRLSRDQGVVLSESVPVHYIPGTLALPSQDDNYAIDHKPHQIDILFKPEQNCLYKSKFRISIQYGPTFDLIVKGRGTYDQEFEKK